MTDIKPVDEYAETAENLLTQVAEAYDAEDFDLAAQLAQIAMTNISMAQFLLMQEQVTTMMEHTKGARLDTKSFTALATEMLQVHRRDDDLGLPEM